MLVLTRKVTESIMIGDQIEIVVLEINGETARLGIRAPKDIQIYRKEIFESIRASNQQASKSQITPKNLTEIFQKTQEKAKKDV